MVRTAALISASSFDCRSISLSQRIARIAAFKAWTARMSLFVWLDARSEPKTGYGVRIIGDVPMSTMETDQVGLSEWDAAFWSMAAVLVA
jgi:hypothetical protein